MLRGSDVQEELLKQGMSIQAISEMLGWDRKTVRKYLVGPEAAPACSRRKGGRQGRIWRRSSARWRGTGLCRGRGAGIRRRGRTWVQAEGGRGRDTLRGRRIAQHTAAGRHRVAREAGDDGD